MIAGMNALVEAVQTNCDIADARHARDVSLCTYLLGMREFYRWEHQLPYGVSPPRDEVGRWISEREIETLVLHEEGELAAGRLLGEAWARKLDGFSGKRAELLARAVRDNLADCLVTLPGLLQRGATDSLHFWFSTFDGLRRELFPRLVEAYSIVGAGSLCVPGIPLRGQATALLAAAAEAGRIHFTELGRRLLELDEAAIAALSHEAAAIALS
jgi:hypothetical protein